MPYTKNSAGGTMMNWCSLTKMAELLFTTKHWNKTNGSINITTTNKGVVRCP